MEKQNAIPKSKLTAVRFPQCSCHASCTLAEGLSRAQDRHACSHNQKLRNRTRIVSESHSSNMSEVCLQSTAYRNAYHQRPPDSCMCVYDTRNDQDASRTETSECHAIDVPSSSTMGAKNKGQGLQPRQKVSTPRTAVAGGFQGAHPPGQAQIK